MPLIFAGGGYINTAAELGIIPSGGTELRPRDIASRDELALMLYNASVNAEKELMPHIDDDGSAWTPIY